MPKYVFIKEDEDVCVCTSTSILSAYREACKSREWNEDECTTVECFEVKETYHIHLNKLANPYFFKKVK